MIRKSAMAVWVNLLRAGGGGGDTLFRRLLLICATAVVIICTVAALWHSQIVWPNFVQLEEREAGYRLRTVVQALRSEEDRLGDLVNTYGVWDAPYDYLRGANPSYVDTDLTPEALDQIEVDVAILFDTTGRPVFRGLRRPELTRVVGELERAAQSAPGLILSGAPSRTALLVIGSRAFIVAQRRVVRTDGTGISPGATLFAREISPQVQERMADLASVDFRLLAAPASGGPPRPDTRVSGRVHDAWGGQTLQVEVIGQPELLLLGRNLIFMASVGLLAVLAMFWVAFALVLVEAVIKPVRALIGNVRAQARGEARHSGVKKAPAEIVELAEAFDAAFTMSRNEAALHKAAREDAIAARAVAEESANAKSRFLATMSHELRTPLNAVIGYTEMVQETALEAGRVDEAADLGRVLCSAQSLLGLINSILDLTRLDSGRMPVFAEDFSVADLAVIVADTVRPVLAAKGINFVVDVAHDIGAAYSDPARISQCLANVLSNAAKFTSAGEVRFRVARRREGEVDWLLFAVEDTGIGMSPEQTNRVFEPFMQADETIARRYGGAGLGLTITRDLLTRLGGKIGILSEPGLGARVVMRIPARLPGAAAPIALKPAA